MWVVAARASPVSASPGVDGLEMEKSRAFLVAPQVGIGALAASPDFGGHALLCLFASSGGGCHCWAFRVGEGNTGGVLALRVWNRAKRQLMDGKGSPTGKYKTGVIPMKLLYLDHCIFPRRRNRSCATPVLRVHSIVCMSRTTPVERAKVVEVRGGMEQDHTVSRVLASSTRWVLLYMDRNDPRCWQSRQMQDKRRKETNPKLIDRVG